MISEAAKNLPRLKFAFSLGFSLGQFLKIFSSALSQTSVRRDEAQWAQFSLRLFAKEAGWIDSRLRGAVSH
jgi:hypothetical protein